MGLAKSFRDLDVYKLAFETAMEIFEISKKFLTEQGRKGIIRKVLLDSEAYLMGSALTAHHPSVTG